MGSITICGSMKFFGEMTTLSQRLGLMGFDVHLPTQEEIEFHSMTPAEKIRAKKQYIQEHKDRIRISDYVVIANYSKNGVNGYVGPNTLIEIAFSDAFDKPIFILEEPGPQPCFDELMGFELRPFSTFEEFVAGTK